MFSSMGLGLVRPHVTALLLPSPEPEKKEVQLSSGLAGARFAILANGSVSIEPGARLADVRFGLHHGLNWDLAPGQKVTRNGHGGTA
jgi:hypothetical protein